MKKYSINEVDIILEVLVSDSGVNYLTYDLNNKQFPGVPKKVKVRAFSNGCYLGRKTFSSGSSRWVDIDREDILSKMNDVKFIQKHLPKRKDYKERAQNNYNQSPNYYNNSASYGFNYTNISLF